MKCTFMNWACRTQYNRYAGTRNVAISLVADGDSCDTFDGEPIATATVNITRLPDGAVAIKDWSENMGMAEALAEAGIIDPKPVGHLSSGYVLAPIHHLTDKAKAEIRFLGLM